MIRKRTGGWAFPAIVLFVGALLLVASSAMGLADDDDDDDHKRAGGRKAAAKLNETCFECHIDFKEEELTVEHSEHGVSCVRCHGESVPHMQDETRGTAPDAIFRGKSMKVFCRTCHSPEEWAEEEEHREEMAKEKPKTCLQCHFDHVLVELPPKKK